MPSDSITSYYNINTNTWGTVGTGVTASSEFVGNGWYRVKLKYTATAATPTGNISVGLASADLGGSFAAAGTEAVYAWGAQVVQGDWEGQYIQTVASAEYTRLYVNAMLNTDLLPLTDLAYSLGDSSHRFNGYFGNVTSTNATTTNLFATNATITNINFTNVTATFLNVTNVNSNLIPLANNLYNIGSSALSWHSIFASSTVFAGGVTSTGNINPFTNGLYDIGISGTAWKSVFASSTIHAGGVTSTGDVNPFANNTYDLGEAGSAWKNIYSSGTSYLTNIQASSGKPTALSYSWVNDTDTGWYHSATDGQIMFVINGTQNAVWDSSYFNIFSSLIPGSNNTKYLGVNGNAWKYLYVSSTAYLGNMIVGNSTTTNATTTILYVSDLAQLPTNTTINSQSVCLANGTNCPAAATGDINWTYDDATGVMRNTT
ncbi:MAG: hypothetical protein AAB570_01410, partial [Patescibacteria group bacterium]